MFILNSIFSSYDLPDSSSDAGNDDTRCESQVTSNTCQWKCVILSNILSALAGAIVCFVVFMALVGLQKQDGVPDAHHGGNTTLSSAIKNGKDGSTSKPNAGINFENIVLVYLFDYVFICLVSSGINSIIISDCSVENRCQFGHVCRDGECVDIGIIRYTNTKISSKV